MATKGKQFKVGDVVVLTSGGFPMTVTQGTNHEGEVRVSWFNFNALCSGSFAADALHITKLRLDPSCNTIE